MGGRSRMEMVGQRFGRLVVVSLSHINDAGALIWDCVCDCGSKTVATGSNLRGKTKSCGCLRREVTSKSKAKHRGIKLPEYSVWRAMRGRCQNENSPDWPAYGGRGIKVCERWNDFKVFHADMGNRPSKKHSIDRYPDNDGNYEPGNWATAKQQANNRRARSV